MACVRVSFRGGRGGAFAPPRLTLAPPWNWQICMLREPCPPTKLHIAVLPPLGPNPERNTVRDLFFFVWKGNQVNQIRTWREKYFSHHWWYDTSRWSTSYSPPDCGRLKDWTVPDSPTAIDQRRNCTWNREHLEYQLSVFLHECRTEHQATK